MVHGVAGFLLCWCVSLTSLPNAVPRPFPEKMDVNRIFGVFVTTDAHVEHVVNNFL